MKQDVDTESLLKMGPILVIFQMFLTALAGRKEVATPNYAEKNPCVPWCVLLFSSKQFMLSPM